MVRPSARRASSRANAFRRSGGRTTGSKGEKLLCRPADRSGSVGNDFGFDTGKKGKGTHRSLP